MQINRRDALHLVGLGFTAKALLPAAEVPAKTVVLSFDDGVSSHATLVGPMLKKYGFPATFFVCEFPPDFTDKHKYMSWEQIRGLHAMGFEIGNHTLTHKHVNRLSAEQLGQELDALEERCAANGIPKPISFAYPGYDTSETALAVLKARGYRWARAGLDRPFDPHADNPLLIPGFTIKGADEEAAIGILKQAQAGRIVVLTLHGIPDYAHDWVSVDPKLFERMLDFLKHESYTVLALRDLAPFY